MAPLPLYKLLLIGLYRLLGTRPLVAIIGPLPLYFPGYNIGLLGPRAPKYPR
jgi:hypothetical protein